MDHVPYNAWKWVSLSSFSPVVQGGLIACLTLATLGSFYKLRRAPSRRVRLSLGLLRAWSCGCLVFFLLEPGIRRIQEVKTKGRVVVLVDHSASMKFPASAGDSASVRSRGEEVSLALRQFEPEFATRAADYQFEVRSFDGETSTQTNLLEALRNLNGETAGVLLFSDGMDNAGFKDANRQQIALMLKDFPSPVSTFGVGQRGLRDLAIESVRVDDFTFVRTALTVDVAVRGRGFAHRSVPVTLKKEGETVGLQTVSFDSDDSLKTLVFSLTPDRTGRFVYTLSMPLLPGEAVVENNRRSFALKVIRDRVRVLLVVGRPSWDERFLRELLKQDANIDLVSFYILRTLSDDPKVHNQEKELSLIPFPMEEIFDTKLNSFDVVIFQNFGYADPSLSISLYERNLERYVFNGGGFLILGGDHAWGEGVDHLGHLGVLADALPVEATGSAASLATFQPQLTQAGERHPITAGAAWAALPSLPGLNLTRAKPSATVLLEDRQLRTEGVPPPVLALWDYGKGRSVALTTDSSWFWALPARVSGTPDALYSRFYKNTLRWLVHDPDLNTVQVSADAAEIEPGKSATVNVLVRGADYQPEANAAVIIKIFSVESGKEIGSRSGTTQQEGTLQAVFPSLSLGAYKLHATATKEGKWVGEGEDSIAVRPVGPELLDPSVNPSLLKEISNATGGKAFSLPISDLPALPLRKPPVVELGRSEDQPIWDRWYFLVCLVLSLSAEWWVRRRWGYA